MNQLEEIIMRFSSITLALFSILLTLGAASNVASAAAPKQGYVEYEVDLLNQQTPLISFVLNESAQPAGQNGFVHLTINLISSIRNLTYSRLFNASSLPEIFPYVPGLTNETFSYQTRGVTLTVQIHSTGKTPVSFNNRNYQGTNYDIYISAAYISIQSVVTTSGTIVTFPSGLVYYAQLQTYGTYFVHIQLLATSLPLVDPPNSAFPVGAALLSLGLIGAVGFAAPTVFLKIRSKPKQQPAVDDPLPVEKKPSYWVD